MASFETVYWALPDSMPRASRERLAALAVETFPPDVAPEECTAWCLHHPHAHDAAIRLLRAVHRVGGELGVVQPDTSREAIVVRDPDKRVSAAMRREVQDIAPDMITLLRFGPAWELTLVEFARCGGVCRLPLGEREVLVAANNADPCHPALVEAEAGSVFRVQTLPAAGRAYFARLGEELKEELKEEAQ